MKKFITTILIFLITLASFGKTLSVEFIEDDSYTEKTNYHEIINIVNEIYFETNIDFKCGAVHKKLSPFSHYNLPKLCMTTPAPKINGDIAVYVVGKNEGEDIGQAVYRGYFRGRPVVYANLSFFSSVRGDANIIAHEIGHLFGLAHCHHGVMAPNSSEFKLEFSKEEKQHLRDLNL